MQVRSRSNNSKWLKRVDWVARLMQEPGYFDPVHLQSKMEQMCPTTYRTLNTQYIFNQTMERMLQEIEALVTPRRRPCQGNPNVRIIEEIDLSAD